MAAAESSAGAGDLPSSPPMTMQEQTSTQSDALKQSATSPSPQSRRSEETEEDESQQFWDVQSTADRSLSSSPPLGVRATAATGRSASRHIRDASFTTAVEFGASTTSNHNSVPESTSQTALPPRLHNERQRWLSRTNSGESSPSTATSAHESSSNTSSPNLRRNPASYSSHGIATSDGPPPALLNRSSKSKEPLRRSPTSRTFLQRGLQPLKLLASRSSHKRQDTEDTITAKSAGDKAALTQEQDIQNNHDQELLSPKSQILSPSMDGRPRSSRRQMNDLDADGYANNNGTTHVDGSQTQDFAESSTEGRSSEDVFLNLAQDDVAEQAAPAQDRLERRRVRDSESEAGHVLTSPKSRLTRPSQRQSLPATAYLDRADSSDMESAYGPPSAYGNNQRMYSRRPSQIASTGLGDYQDSSPVSSTGRFESLTRLDEHRQRYLPSQRASSVVNGPKSPEMTTYGRRRPSLTGELPSPGFRGQTYRPSKLNNTVHDFGASSNVDGPHQTGRNRALSGVNGEGNSSVVSGPSAVWDELEELKSRIKRMESNGRPGSTSGAAVQSSTSGSNERPRTATTTVTTISSSPKQNKNNRKPPPSTAMSNNEDGESVQGSQSVHPLLYQALARSKTTLSPTVYRVLEATATEAVEMVNMTSNAGSQGTNYTTAGTINGAAVTDRQVRRKADNMCRTLTELCIALSDKGSSPSRPGTSTNSPAVAQSVEGRPGSKSGPTAAERYQEESPMSGAYARHAMRSTSVEPDGVSEEARSSPSRALSRIEARRNSLNILGLSNSASNSPREPKVSEADEPAEEDSGSHQQRISSIPSRLSRAGTSLLRSRRRVGDNEVDDDPTIRPMSRAMTDIGGSRETQLRVPSLRDRRNPRLSREYTSKEPLPERAPLAQSSQNSSRRVTGTHLPQPSLLRQGDSNRRYAELGAPPVAYDSNDRMRMSSSGTLYPASRRSSAGLSIANGRKPRQSGLAIETGGGE